MARWCMAAFDVSVHCALALAEALRVDVGQPLPDRAVEYLTLESPPSSDATLGAMVLAIFWLTYLEDITWADCEADVVDAREYARRILEETRAWVSRSASA